MARKRSSQKGRIALKGDRLTLRFAVRDGQRPDGCRECREFLPIGITQEQAERIRVERMQTINRLNNSLLVQPVMTVQSGGPGKTAFTLSVTRRGVSCTR
ncbi:MAG TPA: hypothetical protein VHQ95_15295 [Pyrinomonadaceae bacterium]|nr:hypothetical protein [Pyrinomonadaceae bacterium]